MSIESGAVIAFRLRLYARKLWGVLNRTKGGHKRKLKHKLEELSRWAVEAGLSSLPVFAPLSARITELASDGEPDRPSSNRDCHRGPPARQSADREDVR